MLAVVCLLLLYLDKDFAHDFGRRLEVVDISDAGAEANHGL